MPLTFPVLMNAINPIHFAPLYHIQLVSNFSHFQTTFLYDFIEVAKKHQVEDQVFAIAGRNDNLFLI